ncbi:MAG TPA: amidohydrolase family protein [Acidimicrobiia bacterium]|nr:amidohydrolase family protein [Acidimicrobiia bacterium]
MTRRKFLKTSCAMAATLLAIDTTALARSGGRYLIDPEARLDEGLASTFFQSGEFVFDMQGHLLEYDLDPSTRGNWFWGSSFPQAACTDEHDPRACFSMNHFLEEMFVRSDTRMVALSGLPIMPEGSPLSPEIMEDTRAMVERLSGDDRVVVNALALPQAGPVESVLDEMGNVAAGGIVRGWKTFTHFAGPWRLDDGDPALPQVGNRFLDQLVHLETPVLCVHKGLSGGDPASSPADIGPAARDHSDVSIVVYHSGYEVGVTEGPYTADRADVGVNRLITSLRQAGIGPGRNVYAEIGSTWWHLLKRPNEAAHVIGKLLLAVGEDNLLWGTDSILYGTPQPQIDAFRAFSITPEFQDTFGYPELTETIKGKVLGLNAVRLYGLAPVSGPVDPADILEARREHPLPNLTWGPRTASEVRAYRAHHRGWP